MEVTVGRTSEPADSGSLGVSQTDNEWMNKLIDQLSLSQSNGSPYVLLSADQAEGLPTEDEDDDLVDEDIESPDEAVPQQRASLINPQLSSAEQARKLLERFVDLEQPVITEKMSQFIMDPVTCQRFMAFISRLRETPRSPGEARDVSNLDAVRRSYRAMKVLMRRTPTVDNFIAARLKEIIEELFNVLDDRSDGLILHFTHTFENLVRRDPPAVIQILLADNGAILRKFVDFCYVDGIADAIVSVIRANVNENMVRRRVLDTLRTQGLIKTLMLKSSDPDVEVSTNACENLDRICEALYGDVAMPFLLFDPANFKEAAVVLSKTFCATQSTGQQKFDSIKTLQSTYMHWRRLTKQGAPDAHYPDTFGQALVDSIPAICDGVVDISSRRVMQHKVSLNAYSVSNSLSLLRLTAIKLVYLTLTHGDTQDADPRQLETVPASFWKLLTTLFLTHEHSSIFHALFYRIFDMVMKSGSEATVKNLLGKPKFVTKMLELYDTDKSHSSRGYILLLCNYLRIMSEVQPATSYLNNLLSQNPKWLEMAPQLDAETKRNYLGTVYEKGLTAQRPELHIGPRLVRGENGSAPGTPVHLAMQTLSTMQQQSPPSYSEPVASTQDLGFAETFKQHVGLTGFTPMVESETSLSEMDVDALAKSFDNKKTSGGGEGGGSGKKKNNKKKKKKAGNSSENSSSPSHSECEDEVDIHPSDPLVH